MQEKAKEPEIRFAGFTGAWEQRKLGELYEKAGSGGTPNASNASFYMGTIPFLGISDIKGRYITKTAKHISEKGLKSSAAWMVPSGAISLAMYASVGKVGITSVELATSQAFYNMVFASSSLRNFIFSRLEKASDNDEWLPLVSTGTQSNLNADKIKNWCISVPNSNEQKLVGEFFKKLDNLLTLHQRKYEKLLNIKKSMLEKMFPKEGEVVPKIRFKGFTGAWEQRKLGNLGETYTGLSGKSKEDFGHGTAKFITYMNVYSNPVSDPEGTDLIEVDNRQNTVRKGDVLFTTSSETPEEVGMSSVVFESIENTYLNSFCFGYRPKIEFNNFYLAFLLRSGGFRKNIIFLAQGISRYNISKNAVMNIPIPIPAKEEQEAIGDFFKHLDALLTLHQRKLEMLKNVKQAFLEKMFV